MNMHLLVTVHHGGLLVRTFHGGLVRWCGTMMTSLPLPLLFTL